MFNVLIYFGIGFLVSLGTLVHLYTTKNLEEELLKSLGLLLFGVFLVLWPAVLLVYLGLAMVKISEAIGDSRAYKNIVGFITKIFFNMVKLFNFIVFDWFCDKILNRSDNNDQTVENGVIINHKKPTGPPPGPK